MFEGRRVKGTKIIQKQFSVGRSMGRCEGNTNFFLGGEGLIKSFLVRWQMSKEIETN